MDVSNVLQWIEYNRTARINIKPDILMDSHKVPMSTYKYIIIITMNKSVDNKH